MVLQAVPWVMFNLQGEYMPKKKLTKAQVRKILKQWMNGLLRLLMDKAGHPDSFVPLSLNKLIELDKVMAGAFRRVK